MRALRSGFGPARRLRGLLDGRRRVLSSAVEVQGRNGTVAPINKLRGFIEYERNPEPYRPPETRLLDYEEINAKHEPLELKRQAARCMDCGTPFCQTHTGCPISNIIPEFNNLVFEDQWKDAYINLTSTNNFPEFTGRVCPAPCEGACVSGIVDKAVTIKNMECAPYHQASPLPLSHPTALLQRHAPSGTAPLWTAARRLHSRPTRVAPPPSLLEASEPNDRRLAWQAHDHREGVGGRLGGPAATQGALGQECGGHRLGPGGDGGGGPAQQDGPPRDGL